jgi:hypothetical protein
MLASVRERHQTPLAAINIECVAAVVDWCQIVSTRFRPAAAPPGDSLYLDNFRVG